MFFKKNSTKTVAGKAIIPKWQRFFDQETNIFYYYNTSTKVSQWEKPEEWMTKEEKEHRAKEEQKTKAFFQEMENNILKKLSQGAEKLKKTRSQRSLFSTSGRLKSWPSPVPSNRKPAQKPEQVSETLLQLAVAGNGYCTEHQHGNCSVPIEGVHWALKPRPIERRNTSGFDGSKHFSKRLKSLRRCNTTSTVYLQWTLTSPDISTLILCVCAVIRAKMVETTCRPFYQSPEFLTFQDNQIGDAPHSSCPSFLGADETAVEMPTFEEVCEFYEHVVKRSQLDVYLPGAIIMSLIYIERLTSTQKNQSSFLLHPNNWKSVILVSLVVANKMWDDLSVKSGDFCTVCPEYPLERLRDLEVAFLSRLKYDITVKPSEYAKYYFQLRSYAAIIGVDHEVFTHKPLNTEVLRVLKEKHATSFEKSLGKPIIEQSENSVAQRGAQSPSCRQRERSTSQTSKKMLKWMSAKGEYYQRLTPVKPPNASLEEILYFKVTG